MRSLTRALLLFLTLMVAGSSATARAQDGRSPDRLFFVTMSLGLGDCDDILCGPLEADTGPLFATSAGFYVRPIRYFAAGVDFTWTLMSAEDRDVDRQEELANTFLLNLQARGILALWDIAEPWAGIGFGYAHWGYSWIDGRDDDSRTLNGVDMQLSAGADFRLADRWWLGGMVRFSFPFWDERCRIEYRDGVLDRDECRAVETLDLDEQQELPDLLWYVGVTGRFDFYEL